MGNALSCWIFIRTDKILGFESEFKNLLICLFPFFLFRDRNELVHNAIFDINIKYFIFNETSEVGLVFASVLFEY